MNLLSLFTDTKMYSRLFLALMLLLLIGVESRAQVSVPVCTTSMSTTNLGPSFITNPGPYNWTYPAGLTFSCNPCQVVATVTASTPGSYPVSVSFTGGSINYLLTFGADDTDGDSYNDCDDCNDNSAIEKPGQVWYKDSDGDGYAETGAATITQCARPAGYKAQTELTATTGDCNDGNAAINPAASEICDGLDNNCNGFTDEGLLATYYRDADGDGYGNPAMAQQSCSAPPGYVSNNIDCNDNSAVEKPGQVWYKDSDGDGYAETGAATITQCARPAGYKAQTELTATTGDCNDGNAAINPAASEICDGLDNNCNNAIDDGINCCPSSNVIYVNDDAPGANNGSSWTDAFTDLQDALALAGNCPNVMEIWVAAGTYKPTSGTDRNAAFVMKDGVAIYGGFNGTETQLSQRDWAANVAILSGDIGIPGNNADNTFSVIRSFGIGNSSILDGFTVTQANATPASGDILGGGIYNEGSSPIIRNCIFSNNTGSYVNAGVLNVTGGTPTIINCIFINNVGSAYSSGIFNFTNTGCSITNCTFYGNQSAILNQSVDLLSVSNSILWGNNNQINNITTPATLTVSNSIIQGDFPGTGNLNEDPLFVDPTNGDFRLPPCSPAIDAGDDAANTTTKDLAGNPRKVDAYPGGSQVDMGAYEAAAGDNTPPTISCPGTQTLALGSSCSASLPDYTSLATTSDNCGVQGVTQSPATGTQVNGTGSEIVNLIVTDVNGNSNSCQFTVNKVDNTSPTISCPGTQTLALGAECTAALPDYTGLATTSDNCGVQSVTQSPSAGATASGSGNMEVTLTVTDVNGNSNSCQFTVNKVDNTSPTISCPGTQTLALGGDCTAALPDYTSLATTSDNCGVQSVTQSPLPGATASGAGNMTVTLTVLDVNGNSNSCQLTVSKVDNTAPSISCPATQTLVLGAECTAPLPNYTSLATTSDNCGCRASRKAPRRAPQPPARVIWR
ncbi:MAG: HYR domain-containing protein [Lewinellaceae bacterium]|nr:HYR domain-containing protein [Lewinellaceae bacterium]